MALRAALELASQDPTCTRVVNPGTRGLDMHRVASYLNAFPPERSAEKDVATQALAHTHYIPEAEFLNALETSFQKFVENIQNRPFYIYVPVHKLGSEMVLLVHLWSRLRQMNVKGFVGAPRSALQCTVEGKEEVLIIDDAVYTGINTISKIDELSYESRGKHSPENPIIFHLVIPYASVSGKIPLETFTGDQQYVVVHSYYTQVFPIVQCPDEDVQMAFDLQTPELLPIYFDHKVANNFATFPMIYLEGYIPGGPKMGPLIKGLPDTDLKMRLWKKHFQGVTGPPQ